MSAILKTELHQIDESIKLKQIEKSLQIYSTDNTFTDDKWYLDKFRKSVNQSKPAKTLYFPIADGNLKTYLKVFSLFKLNEGSSLAPAKTACDGVKKFVKFLELDYPETSFFDIKYSHIIDYNSYLAGLNIADRSKETYWGGLKNFINYLSLYNVVPFSINQNPFLVPRDKRKSSKKYLAKDIIKKIDVVMDDEKHPLQIRLAYWIGRLIPCRITEICSMNLSSFNRYIEDEYIIEIPYLKDGSNASELSSRKIIMKSEGMGEYLLDLLNRQSKIVNEININLHSTNLLFIYYKEFYSVAKGVKTTHFDKSETLNETIFNRYMRKVIKSNSIQDEDGKLVQFTTGISRHVGITNRIYSGFRYIDLINLTGHSTTDAIVDNYSHVLEPKQAEIQEEIGNYDSEIFKGSIISKSQEKRYIHRPFAKDLITVGICSDYSNCQSDIFGCFDCDYFIPDNSSVEYYQNQLEYYQEKLRVFAHQPMIVENTKYNITCYEKLIARIQRT